MLEASGLRKSFGQLLAVEGVSFTVRRGFDLAGAAPAVGVTAGFALLFTVVAIWRFRWEE